MEGTRSEASEGRERLEAGREASKAFLRCKKDVKNLAALPKSCESLIVKLDSPGEKEFTYLHPPRIAISNLFAVIATERPGQGSAV